MSKRILFGGLLAVALAFGMAGTAQAQYPGHHHHHGGYGYGPGYGYGGVRVVGGYYPQSIYRPVVVAPAVLPAVPFPGYGTAIYNPPAVYGGVPYAGYGTYGGLNVVTPGISFGIGIRR